MQGHSAANSRQDEIHDQRIATPQSLRYRENLEDPSAKLGETDPGLEEVQSFLRAFGYLQLADYTEGELDSSTSGALHQYQEQNNLPSSGLFDNPTREQMNVSLKEDTRHG